MPNHIFKLKAPSFGVDAGRWIHGSAAACSLAATAFLAYLAAQFGWLLVAGPTPSVDGLSAPSRAAPRDLAVDFSLLQRQTPFKAVEFNSASPRGEAAPATDLSIKLYGVRTAPNGEGVAIIAEDGGEQGIYRVGDEIDFTPGVTVETIYGDGVLLLRNGRVERLSIDPNADAPGITRIDEDGLSAPPEAAPIVTPTTPARSATRQATASLARGELAELFQTIRIEDAPAAEGGGVMVFPLSSEGPFRRSGLQPRDIVDAIDGAPLNASTNYQELIARLETQNEIVLSVRRRDEDWRLSIKLNDQ